jgi:hypothetical protein
MTKTAARKAERATRKLALEPTAQNAEAARRLALAALNKRLAYEAHLYAVQWCDPAGYRQRWQQEWRADVAAMREQRLDRIKRRDDLIAWLLQYETWREENGRPIAYCRRAPAPEVGEAKAA